MRPVNRLKREVSKLQWSAASLAGFRARASSTRSRILLARVAHLSGFFNDAQLIAPLAQGQCFELDPRRPRAQNASRLQEWIFRRTDHEPEITTRTQSPAAMQTDLQMVS